MNFFHPEWKEHRQELKSIKEKLEYIMATLDDLVAKVTALKTVDDSVVALLNGLSTQLKAAIAANDPTKIQAVADALDAQSKELSDAVTANTPSA